MTQKNLKKLTFYESWLIQSKKYRNSWEKYKKKNKNRISFMLIPHDENHIVKIELSFFMLYFIGFLTVILTFLSLYYLLGSRSRQNNPEIYDLNRRNTAVFLLYEQMNRDLKKHSEKLKNQTDELNKYAWGTNPENYLISRDFMPENIGENARVTEEISPNDIFQKIVNNSLQIAISLSQILPEFQNAAGYLLARESIFSSLPKGRPLKPGVGFVTSSFGNRIDPFGLTSLGEFHSGVDFASGEGTPIYATAPGVVAKMASSVGGLGNAVKIDHINGIYTLYGHCSLVLVREGDLVNRGDKIGLVGSTGKATGAHVHYEVRIGSDPPVDPVEFINLE